MIGGGLLYSLQWSDTRDMAASGRTEGCIDHELLLQVMADIQSSKYGVTRCSVYRGAGQWHLNPARNGPSVHV
eukprot:4396724-Pyramimonas_sp.AAC.1